MGPREIHSPGVKIKIVCDKFPDYGKTVFVGGLEKSPKDQIVPP